MKGTPGLLLALVVLVVPGLEAQTSASADVQATVTADLAVTATGSTDFGTLGNARGNVTVNPAALGAGQSAATITVVGSPGASVTITTSNTTLGTTGGATIPFTGQLYIWDGSNTPGNTSNYGGSANVTIRPDGSFYLWLGGQITLEPNQAAGDYTGQVTVAVTYN